MRKIIASTFLSVDGFIVGPNEDMSWVMENFNDEMAHYAGDLMSSMDTVLLGRVTYEIMARAWPNMTEESSPGADTMNAVPKVVVSSTLTAAPWGTYGNVRLVKDDLAQAITALKEQPGKNIVIYGSATLVRGLTRLGLIDEYHLLIHPIVLGSGKPLFAGLDHAVKLTLLHSESFANGVVVSRYAPVRG